MLLKLIKFAYYKLGECLCAASSFNALKKLNDLNFTYYILPYSIGDSCYVMAWIEELFKQKNDKNIVFVCTKTVDHLLNFYTGRKYKTLVMDFDEIFKIFNFLLSTFGQNYEKKHKNIKLLYLLNFIHYPNMNFYSEKITQLDIIRMGLRLKDDSKYLLSKFDLKKSNEYISKYDLKKNKTIIFSPYANSVHCVYLEFYDEIVEKLKNKGYKLFTNVINEQLPIGGTEPISFPLEVAKPLVEYCGYLIGTRSGFFDLIMGAKAKIFSICHDEFGPNSIFSLKGWKAVNTEINEYVFLENDKKNIINDIIFKL